MTADSPHRVLPGFPSARPWTGWRTGGRRYGASRTPTPSTATAHWPVSAARSSRSTLPAHGLRIAAHGGVFSYTHTDCMARYKRMRGFNVFYPIGWDDNGLPTEKRVRITTACAATPHCTRPRPCRPSRATRSRPNPADEKPISRQNFIELCDVLTVRDEGPREPLPADGLLARLVDLLSDDRRPLTGDLAAGVPAQRDSRRGHQSEAPGLWDVTFQTAVAQAELGRADYPGHYHRVAFHGADGPIFIETTRPGSSLGGRAHRPPR